MDNNFDTIFAIITPIARSAVGIIRISGTEAFEIAQKIFSKPIKPKMINYGYVINNNERLDEVILLAFQAPHSYTGEDVIEIQTHGNPNILNIILDLLITHGARLATNGEFTKRAFLNRRIDLTQAEAVMDVIQAGSEKAISSSLNNLGGYLKNKISLIKSSLIDLYSKLIASIDFPDDVREVDTKDIVSICSDNILKINDILNCSKSHNFIRDGISACLVGRPNAGKSSLFNALLSYNRAIVTEIEGTTRDTIKETLNLGGYLINFIDTAGIRDKENADKVEKIGIDNSIQTIKQSEIVLFLFEKSKDEISDELIELAKDKKYLFIKTKHDINPEIFEGAVNVSSVKGFGLDELKNEILRIIKDIIPEDTGYTSNKRQQACLVRAKEMLNNVIETTKTLDLADLCATDLKGAILALDEITGEVLTDKILDNIFDNFCIGK